MSTASQRKLTVAEYLAREEQSETKHEYCRGEVFAMAGGTFNHALIAANILGLLKNHLQGSGCLAIGSDLRISAKSIEFITYPDVSVLCAEPQFDPQDRNAVTNPQAIIEVLSPSTERYDRTAKFGFFRTIPSLKLYVLVSQQEARVEVFTRGDNNSWQFSDAVGLNATIQFPPLQCELPLAEIYEGVELDPTALRLKPDAND